MEMKQLAYFIKIAQEGSYSKAAAQLSITQPALSMAIRSLQEELGVELFYTFERRQQLTDEGKNLYQRAQHLMDVFQETLESVQKGKGAEIGSIAIGLPPIIGTCYFSDLVASFIRDNPNIKVSIVEDGSSELQAKVLDGSIDIACTIAPLNSNHFNIKSIVTEQNVVVLHPDNPLAQKSILTFKDLKEEHFAMFNSDFMLHHQLMASCRKAGFQPTVSVLSSQWDFIVEVVSQNRAVAVLPKPILDKFPHPGVCWVELDDDMRDWEVILVYSKTRYFSNSCKKFLQYVDTKFNAQ